ncbi:MAG: beta-N-acetylhexosaminidase [Proteobacteria bacterium]|nr:beta-N-acetylhexosaminidase [Pseudomonadota bacterium]MDA1059331.1 beta-N-acetylhexosaminidase [Pseudomonadota bacterium]
MTLPAIFGLAGLELTGDERAFFAETKPLGFILFARNCARPDQVGALCRALRALTRQHDTPILIDQEGGRVARLKPPHWRHPPPARVFGDLWDRDPPAAERAARLNGQLIGAELIASGINVDCAPVLDVPVAGSHDIIGDRAYHTDTTVIAALGRAFTDGLIAAGVLPVVKHIPGHGRAGADSHKELPVVTASLDELEQDFAPFIALRDLPLAMTAHVLFSAVDPDHSATTSATVVEDVIRQKIGFHGLLMSDDISSNMKALPGGFADRARDSIAAGCDVVLHCDGDLNAMQQVSAALPALSDHAAVRWAQASFLIAEPEAVNIPAATKELVSLLGRS